MLRLRAGFGAAKLAARLVTLRAGAPRNSAAVAGTYKARRLGTGAGLSRRSLLLGGSSMMITLTGNEPWAQSAVHPCSFRVSSSASDSSDTSHNADTNTCQSSPTSISNSPRCSESNAVVEETRQALWEAVARGRTRKQIKVQDLGSTKLTGGLLQQDLQYLSDEGSQGWVPLVVIAPDAPPASPSGRPAVVFLHATGGSKENMRTRMMEYAAAGYVTAAIDCRYHGQRCVPSGSEAPRAVYELALVRAWREGVERPFLLDNVWDLVHLLDYLETRADVDTNKVGMTGVSLGGMHSWLCAALDKRVAAVAPVIGVQSFSWAVHHQQFQARVDSIPAVFKAASQDLGTGGKVNVEVVRAVWNRIMPGLLDTYDAALSLPCIAPRPLLVVNGEMDPRCPVEGLREQGWAQAERAYKAVGAQEHFQVLVERGVAHRETEEMRQAVRLWFDKYFMAG